MILHRTLLAMIIAASLASCAATEPPSPSVAPSATCPAELERWTMTSLYFGLTWRQGVISEAQWQDFVNGEVVPRLPEGFTVLVGEGAWRSSRTGQTIRQPSRVLQRLRKADAAQETAIAGVIAAYKTRFQQDSVLRVDTEACGAF